MKTTYICKRCGEEVEIDLIARTHACPKCDHNEFSLKAEGPAICDFCSSPEVVLAYPCRNFSSEIHVPNAPGWSSDGWWAACANCAKLIEAGDRDGLARRAADTAPKPPGMDLKILIRLIRELHDNFWAHRQGPPIEHL